MSSAAAKTSDHPEHRRDSARPRRGQRGGWHGRGRQFDRHSGSFRDSERRTNQGWGTKDPVPEDVPIEGDAPAVEDPTNAEASIEEQAEKVKTLDEYLAEKASLKPRNLPAPRKANEGSDNSEWKNAKPLEKKEESEDFIFSGQVCCI
jgi:plasminogen activator inhibitor 1 RNA-binding protein